jgi:Protein of unknown function (DUF2752)
MLVVERSEESHEGRAPAGAGGDQPGCAVGAPDFWESDGPDEPGHDTAHETARATTVGDRVIALHRSLLLAAVGACVLAFALEERPDGRVALRGLPEMPLPQTCASRTLLGLKCPGCGLTRSVILLARGQWRASWQRHRLGGLFGLVIALSIPYRLLALWRPGRPLIGPRWHTAIQAGLLALLLANWFVELVLGRVALPS